MLSLLPTALLALLFTSLVLSASTSDNNLFKALASKAPKQPEHPICCLKPLTPLEPMDDEILLSFEEWKLKQLGKQAESEPKLKDKDANTQPSPGAPNGGGSDIHVREESPSPSSEGFASSGTNIVQTASEQWSDISPHFRVPLTDRFNYASLDCSARVHTSHRSAKSASSILSSKKDRYLLSPCKTPKEKQFVVVELCDDIRIDTVQLANFEFFSGVFKDFTVSVSKTYTTELDGWTFAGAYKAKNVRGVQSFHPPITLRGFYRYIRIDFTSHYGNEYYCPVSLLRVYGLTHLEEWKWEIWEAESRAKQAELEKGKQFILPLEVAVESPTTPTPASSKSRIENAPSATATSESLPLYNTIIQDAHEKKLVPNGSASEAVLPNVSTTSSLPAIPSETRDSVTSHSQKPTKSTHVADETFMQSSGTPVSSVSSSTGNNIPSPSSQASTSNTSTNSASTTSSKPNSSSTKHSVSNHSSSSSTPLIHGSPSIIVSASSPSVAVIPITPSPLPPAPNGGESIYRTIMNRLAAIETNHTLYMRYIEQQNGAIREVIKRLGEDLGRLEGITRAQGLNHQRTAKDWEKQKYQLQMEYGDILDRIELLSEEIVLEKRLGVAQLCLLLAVLVFLGLTRGSRSEVSPGPAILKRSVREWGKRHLSLSGDWSAPFKRKDSKVVSDRSTSRSRSTSRTRTPPTRPKPLSIKSYPNYEGNGFREDKVAFPSSSRLPRSKEPLGTINVNRASISIERQQHTRTRTVSGPRSRNPSLRSTPVGRRAQHALQRPITPTRPAIRPQGIQRSNSYGLAIALPQSTSWGGAVHAPKSAKKWARTAHLHEVKLAPASARVAGKAKDDFGSIRHDRDLTPRDLSFDKERIDEDVFTSPRFATSLSPPIGGSLIEVEKQTLADSLLLKPAVSMDDSDPWVDTDSVDDGSELGHEHILDVSSSSPIHARSATLS